MLTLARPGACEHGGVFDPLQRYTPEELERQLTPSSRVPDRDVYITAYADRSLSTKSKVPWHTERYGDSRDEVLDYVKPTRLGAPLHVFVHGGYWRALSKDDALFPALGIRAAGAAFATVNYTLCPNGPLELLVEQVVRSVRFLQTEASRLGHDPEQVYLSGHSAGAHLVAMALHELNVRGVVLVSGVYDCVPITRTSINDDIRLDAPTAARLSPLRNLPRSDAAAVIAWGEDDTDEFARQSLAFARAWLEVGNKRPAAFEVAGRNHFDLIFDLGDPTTTLGSATLSQMGLAPS